jgi:3-hydroxybutyryl-CoA dehydratase
MIPRNKAVDERESMASDGRPDSIELSFNGTIVAPGYRFSKKFTFSNEAIRQFAELCGDTNPIHYHAEVAAQTKYKSIIACGPHVIALFTALAGSHFSSLTPMVGLEFTYRFLSAVKANDAIEMSWNVISIVKKASLGGYLAHLQGEAVNQHGQKATSGSGVVLLTQSL